MNFSYFGLGNLVKPYDFRDKEKNIRDYINYMLNRLQSMFVYDGLPDTIPKRMLETYLMVNGHSVVVEHNDNLYVCFGGWGGEPNEYYIPTQYIVANPYLNLFKTYNIGTDCVLVSNDSMYMGLMPLLQRYATSLVENDLSMYIYDINTRVMALIEAMDDSTKASADKFISDIEKGKRSVIASNTFFEGVRALPFSSNVNMRITDLVEYHQYLKASWFNEIGLNANYNMKRESINSNESQLNDDMLLPLIDDMLSCRQQFVSEVNNMFGTNISVEFGSAWKNNEIELEAEQDIMMGGDDDAGNTDSTTGI